MPKKNGTAGKAPTHFETVPLELVKEIAVEDFPTAQKFGVATGIDGKILFTSGSSQTTTWLGTPV